MKKLKTLKNMKSADIFLIAGSCTLVATIATSIVATKKFVEKRNNDEVEEREDKEDLTKREIVVNKVKELAPYYAPTVVGTAVGLVLIYHGRKKYCAVAASASAASAAVIDYYRKQYEYRDAALKEVVDEETYEKVRKKAIENKLADDIPEPKNPGLDTPLITTGRTRCYDLIGGREFWANQEDIQQAALELNEDLFEDDEVTLNDFYYKIGLEDTIAGDMVGWKSDMRTFGKNKCRVVEVVFDSTLREGVPFMTVSFVIPPRPLA